MKLPFKLFKCQNEYCNQKAVRDGHGFCAEHNRIYCRDLERLRSWVYEQKERDPLN